MWNQQNLLRRSAMRAATALAALIVCPAALLSQGAVDPEPEDAAVLASSPARAESRSDVLAMHRARLAGDEAEVRRLESLRAAPVSPGPKESDCGTTLLPTTSVVCLDPPEGAGDSGIQAGDPPYCGGDVRVRGSNQPGEEYGHSMASTSTGELYVTFQADDYDYDRVFVYSSSDGGATWSFFFSVQNSVSDLRDPSIAVGEGSIGNKVIVAYIRDDGSGFSYPEIVSAEISPFSAVIRTVPLWSTWETYDKVVVETDSTHFPEWYAYLTCEGVYDSAANNVNVCTWRSTDAGDSWIDEDVTFGNSDAYPWVDPELSFGTSEYRLFLVTYREDDYTIYGTRSNDYGATWDAAQGIATQIGVPSYDTDPEVAAATFDDNVMMACTMWNGGNGDDAGYSYSQDAGDTWSFFWPMPESTEHDEFAVALTANEGGGSWHLAFTGAQDHAVRYGHRPQDLSTLFEYGPWIVDDMGKCSAVGRRTRKGIASNWYTDRACIAWADYRDGTGDYDSFVDFEGNTGLMCSQRVVYHDDDATVDLHLNAGTANAGRLYILTGTFSGTEPGIWLPGGGAKLPLNIDDLSFLCLEMGPPIFNDFVGPLDGNGTAMAQIDIPANVGLLPGQVMHYAFAVMNPWDFASNAVMIRADY